MSFSIKPTYTHGNIHIWLTVTGPVQENCLLIADDAGEAFLIDPGDDAPKLLALIEKLQLKVAAILLTHSHFDHIGAVQPVREALQLPVYLHPKDLPIYRSGAASAARWSLPFVQPQDPDSTIAQDQIFTAGKVKLKARELFGHAPGHVVFVAQDLPANTNGFVVSGDTLFAGSIGRTDLPMSDHQQLISGIRQELLTLPGDTMVYSGHGPATSIEHEKDSNPFAR